MCASMNPPAGMSNTVREIDILSRNMLPPARCFLLVLMLCSRAAALERLGVEYKIFQFPPDKIPTIDGKKDDWAIVPASYAIGMDQLKETVKGRGFQYDRKDLD